MGKYQICASQLLRMYHDEHMSQTEIAETLGMHQSSVSYYLRKFAGVELVEAATIGGNIRWTAKLKTEVLAMIEGGGLTEHEAQQLYGLSHEELEEWRRLRDEHGRKGLRVTKLHNYRSRNVQPSRSARRRGRPPRARINHIAK